MEENSIAVLTWLKSSELVFMSIVFLQCFIYRNRFTILHSTQFNPTSKRASQKDVIHCARYAFNSVKNFTIQYANVVLWPVFFSAFTTTPSIFPLYFKRKRNYSAAIYQLTKQLSISLETISQNTYC